MAPAIGLGGAVFSGALVVEKDLPPIPWPFLRAEHTEKVMSSQNMKKSATLIVFETYFILQQPTLMQPQQQCLGLQASFLACGFWGNYRRQSAEI